MSALVTTPRLTSTHCRGGCGRPRFVGSPDFWAMKGVPRPRCKACTAAQATEWRRSHPEQHRRIYRSANHRASLRVRYGLTIAEFDVLWAQCDGRCAICKNPETRARRLCLDHDHATGEVRGFLCSRCNMLLGNASVQRGHPGERRSIPSARPARASRGAVLAGLQERSHAVTVQLHTWGCGHIRRDHSTSRWCPACANDRRRRWRHWMALGLVSLVLLLLCAAVSR